MRQWIVAALLVAAPARAQDFLRRYQAADSAGREAVVREQVARGGFPVVEDSAHALFVYPAEHGEREVRVVGDFMAQTPFATAWDSTGVPMERVGRLFVRRLAVEPDARLDYAFVVDGRRTPDPLNPRTLLSGPGGGDASELVMPRHALAAEAVPRPNIPHGTLREVDEPWARPRVTLYLPPGYTPSRRYPTLYTADGSAWIRYVGLPATLDNLIASGEIRPVVAVMIDAAPDRAAWHLWNPEYLAYLGRVVGYVDGHFATSARPEDRVHAGTSSGGRASLHVAMECPGTFANVAMLSPSLSGPMYPLEPYLSGRRRLEPGVRAWLSAGSYENFIFRDTRLLDAYLRRAGVPHEARYTHQGHSFGAWKEAAVPMLRYFFGARRSVSSVRSDAPRCDAARNSPEARGWTSPRP